MRSFVHVDKRDRIIFLMELLSLMVGFGYGGYKIINMSKFHL